MTKKLLSAGLGLGLLAASAAAVAQDAAPAAAPAVAAAVEAIPTLSAGDTAWMLTSTMLVILMIIPGLALFYGGLVRSKNMLSVLAQVFVIFSLITVLWAVYGYSLAFAGEGNFFGGFDKVFLAGIKPDTLSAALATIPEFVFVSFQSTFAAITALDKSIEQGSQCGEVDVLGNHLQRVASFIDLALARGIGEQVELQSAAWGDHAVNLLHQTTGVLEVGTF